jgi:tetratricopeptide (TPR) repeat protein
MEHIMKKILPALLACMIPVIFSVCTTLQKDVSVDRSKDQMELSLSKIEGLIVPLESAGGAEVRNRQSEMAEARRVIADMEKEAAADADYSSRLTAWSGRLAILEGRYSEAQRLYRQSIALSPGNIPAIILSIRLEGDPQKRLEIAARELSLINVSSPGYGVLQIEKARALAEMRRFSEAAGSFDTAFAAALAAVYRENYREIRDRCWELRNVDGSAIDILEKGGMNWKDCIALIKNETRLLRFLTGGRDMSETELFNRLLERGFIPATQDITLNEWPSTRLKPEDIVFRSGAAWIIWHLYAEARADRSLLTRYSARYATGAAARSPITDVPPLSPFFDSILGCVETELVSLSDGRSFKPEQPVRGAELLAALKRIDN